MLQEMILCCSIKSTGYFKAENRRLLDMVKRNFYRLIVEDKFAQK